VNNLDYQRRINDLQKRRHTLLQRREVRGALVVSIDMELNVVRSELQALYAIGCHPTSANDSSNN